jgi:cellulose synthase (UDP-forming)
VKQSFLLRICIVITILLGVNYIAWRWIFSVNWHAWWIAIPLVLAETYNLGDVIFFGLTVWRSQSQTALPPPPLAGLTVDVFITTYNEPIDLVIDTASAALAIRYPHSTWILDDGARAEMQVAAEKLGVGYITRGENWKNQPLHAKAGNLNNALMATAGEFMLILDADQVPRPEILDHTLGYFTDPKIALVQTPQWFGNVSTYDPLGSQAPLFYGPIQQGKNGWNAAFFCGSNAVLRREALMQLGITRYVIEIEHAVVQALKGANRILSHARASDSGNDPRVIAALTKVTVALSETRAAIRRGETIGNATYTLQKRIKSVSKELVADDLHLLAADLEIIHEMHTRTDENWDVLLDIDSTAQALASRELSPMGALEAVSTLLASIDVDRSGEAQPLMPLATISVTEDMATSMRLHALGWKSRYHHETLAVGLAPEDLNSMLKQRLRWAQGTMQVMMRENPLIQRGLTLAQRLMYFSTMWSYLSGYAAVVYIAAPVVFLCFGILPVRTSPLSFFLHFLPFMIVNQFLFFVTSKGISTWRGQQYSLALFPIWIQATTSAIANVVFHRPLGFVVTPKTRQAGGTPWGLIKFQFAATIILLIAATVGVVRLVSGLSEPIGTFVNVAWVLWDIGLMSILIPALRYRGSEQEEKIPL